MIVTSGSQYITVTTTDSLPQGSPNGPSNLEANLYCAPSLRACSG